nr:hypothetical protein [Candidatus Njordarchaeota archaeon]
MGRILVSAQRQKSSISAARVIASAVGVIVGLEGMEHGFFEMLQGNVAPGSVVIDAIGSAQELWPGATEPALTIIPSFLITGILAIIVGLLLTLWAVAFVERKYGAWTLFLLSVALFLVGGGSPPIFVGVLASAVATRINKPLVWWRKHLGVNVRGFLARLWPWSIITFVLVDLFAVLVAITGLPLVLFSADTAGIVSVLYVLGYITDLLLLLAIFSGFAHDIQRRGAK